MPEVKEKAPICPGAFLSLSIKSILSRYAELIGKFNCLVSIEIKDWKLDRLWAVRTVGRMADRA
jgi:hypothetical protein